MKITCLGQDSPIVSGGKDTNFLVKVPGIKGYLAIDCGTTFDASLKELGISPLDVWGVCVTHLHTDHVGGLERLMYQHKYLSGNGSEDLVLITGHDLVKDIWEHTLRGGMEFTSNNLSTLDSFVQVVDLRPDDECSYFDHYGSIIISANTTDHVCTLGGKTMPSHAFHVKENGGHSVVFTGDTKEVWVCGQDDSFIFHDCCLEENSVHVSYQSLIEDLSSHDRKKTYLCHHSNMISHKEAVRDGFAGVLISGEVVLV